VIWTGTSRSAAGSACLRLTPQCSGGMSKAQGWGVSAHVIVEILCGITAILKMCSERQLRRCHRAQLYVDGNKFLSSICSGSGPSGVQVKKHVQPRTLIAEQRRCHIHQSTMSTGCPCRCVQCCNARYVRPMHALLLHSMSITLQMKPASACVHLFTLVQPFKFSCLCVKCSSL